MGYRPRDAEHGVLHRVIDEHLEAFLDAAQHADGLRRPAFVEREFRDFLTGGVGRADEATRTGRARRRRSTS